MLSFLVGEIQENCHENNFQSSVPDLVRHEGWLLFFINSLLLFGKNWVSKIGAGAKRKFNTQYGFR